MRDVVVVPDVVGMTVEEGRRLAHEHGVVLAQPDADGPPLAALTWPDVWWITDQHPAPGTTLYRWDSVVIGFQDGSDGPTGVREPRRPPPVADSPAASTDVAAPGPE